MLWVLKRTVSMRLFCTQNTSGFIRVREMSGKFKFFQGQGIVREFYVVSGKNECFLKCQGNVREFYNFEFVSNDEKQNMVKAVFLTFGLVLNYFDSFKIAFKHKKVGGFGSPCHLNCIYSSPEPMAQVR